MERSTHPPARQRLPFDDALLQSEDEQQVRVVASGTAPWPMPEVAIEPLADEPSIPEPEWLRLEVVGYHFADHPPQPTPYRAETVVWLPPGAKGVELLGEGRSERLPVIFEAS